MFVWLYVLGNIFTQIDDVASDSSIAPTLWKL